MCEPYVAFYAYFINMGKLYILRTGSSYYLLLSQHGYNVYILRSQLPFNFSTLVKCVNLTYPTVSYFLVMGLMYNIHRV